MDGYVDYSLQVAFQEGAEDLGNLNAPHPAQFEHHSTATMSDAHKSFYGAGAQAPMVCDTKPRLTKSQHEMLELEYNKQNKPSTNVKKGFAKTLGVSLDKVNNWFQNRRAKSKQDQKKANGSCNLFQSQQPSAQSNYASDSDTSPAFPSDEYATMMREEQANGYSVQHKQPEFHSMAYIHPGIPAGDHAQSHVLPQHAQQVFDSPQEFNRRTLTQEQFDAYAQNGMTMNGAPGYDVFNSDFSSDQDVMHQVFPDLHAGQVKQQHAYAHPSHIAAPMSSIDSSVPSSISEQSISTFPSISNMRDPAIASSTNGDWINSRSSSMSTNLPEDPFAQAVPHHDAAGAQWQPGQSVPVDFQALNEEFRQAAQARQPMQSFQASDQPLEWPSDDAFVRRESQTASMLAQGMSHVVLQTPQSEQSATFKSPAPPTSIATRRQRPRPAALGLAAMRSQSYSGIAQPGSPVPVSHHNLTQGAPQLRRIRSSNVVGGIAQGRVHKPIPGAPQRSPLVWNFADAVNSPKARHLSSQSSGSLAPPTPLSPNEFSQQEQNRAPMGWQPSGHVTGQPSVHDTGIESGLPYIPPASVPPQNFSSPPHTPMHQPQPQLQHRIVSSINTENTPPQSAPASQSTFPSQAYQLMQPSPPTQSVPVMPPQTQQHYMNVVVPEQQFQPPPVMQQQPAMPMNEYQMNLASLAYTQGVPVVNAHGQLELVIPPQFMQHMQAQRQMQMQMPQSQTQMTYPGNKDNTFEGMMGMFSTAAPAPAMQVTAQVPKQPPQPANEFFVHEYSPPAELKRVATPRRMVDTGPKSYAFTNHGPKDYERGSKKPKPATASNSPASSSGAASSS